MAAAKTVDSRKPMRRRVLVALGAAAAAALFLVLRERAQWLPRVIDLRDPSWPVVRGPSSYIASWSTDGLRVALTRAETRNAANGVARLSDVVVWDVRAERILHRVPAPRRWDQRLHPKSNVYGGPLLAMSPDGYWLLIADDPPRVYNLQQQQAPSARLPTGTGFAQFGFPAGTIDLVGPSKENRYDCRTQRATVGPEMPMGREFDTWYGSRWTAGADRRYHAGLLQRKAANVPRTKTPWEIALWNENWQTVWRKNLSWPSLPPQERLVDISSLQFLPDNRLLAVLSVAGKQIYWEQSKSLKMWSVEGRELLSLSVSVRYRAHAVSGDGRWLVVVGDAGQKAGRQLLLIDTKSGALQQSPGGAKLVASGEFMAFTDVAINHAGDRIAVLCRRNLPSAAGPQRVLLILSAPDLIPVQVIESSVPSVITNLSFARGDRAVSFYDKNSAQLRWWQVR